MSKIPKYLLCTNKEALAGPVVLHTNKPYIIGKIWVFKNGDEFAEFTCNYRGLGLQAIPGYMICITFGGVLGGERIEGNQYILQTLKTILQEMCDFFTKERIEDKPGYYKKFII